MAFFTRYIKLCDLCNYRQFVNSISLQSANHACSYVANCNYTSAGSKRWLSSGAESTPSEFWGPNAYELLGVSETSSFSEIKASFHKLAKETHPDLAKSHTDSSACRRFIQILAAYEILSDVEKRAHYDRKKGIIGSGYFDVLERDFYSAIHAAYYGPEIESLDLLPHCFEAEERSNCGMNEVLHLVSGRDLLGMVRIGNKIPQLSDAYKPKLTSFASDLCQSSENAVNQKSSNVSYNGICDKQSRESSLNTSDAYKDLELHVDGRLVAVATRVPPKSYLNGTDNKNFHDSIHVYLTSCEDLTDGSGSQGYQEDVYMGFSVGSRISLGTITELRTTPEEGSCHVYNGSGVNTHMIMKHRTLLVKHMHWYQVRDKVSVCECRCTRARLPPSKFWLFEPCCGMHDIGGWYVETFGRDKKGKTVPSQRYWDGLDANEHFDMRLHPAMYLLGLAYRTLDIEDARRRKKTVKDIFEAKIFKLLGWCKRLL